MSMSTRTIQLSMSIGTSTMRTISTGMNPVSHSRNRTATGTSMSVSYIDTHITPTCITSMAIGLSDVELV
jgi:hypothetical protein